MDGDCLVDDIEKLRLQSENLSKVSLMVLLTLGFDKSLESVGGTVLGIPTSLLPKVSGLLVFVIAYLLIYFLLTVCLVLASDGERDLSNFLESSSRQSDLTSGRESFGRQEESMRVARQAAESQHSYFAKRLNQIKATINVFIISTAMFLSLFTMWIGLNDAITFATELLVLLCL
jgi:hypothetical protein